VNPFVLICAECIAEGKMPERGTAITSEPPFAIAVHKGESLCRNHLEAS
jgi:hypothetical protein